MHEHLKGLKLPSLNVRHETMCYELDKLSYYKDKEVKDISSLDISHEDLHLEDLDGENKGLISKILKFIVNVKEDFKQIKDNFERLNKSAPTELIERVERLSGNYSKLSGSITNSSILDTFSVYDRLGVVSGYSVDNYIKYADWAKNMIFDKQTSAGINDFVAAIWSNKSDYEYKGKSTKYLDQIKDKEIRDWLNKDTQFGAVARIAGGSTYLVSLHKSNRFMALLSKNGLMFGGACLRVDNYSCDAPSSIPSLSESDYKKLLAFCQSECQNLQGYIKECMNHSTNFSFFDVVTGGLQAARVVRNLIGVYRLARMGVQVGPSGVFSGFQFVDLFSKFRTADNLYKDWMISYIKYISALIAILEEHSA